MKAEAFATERMHLNKAHVCKKLRTEARGWICGAEPIGLEPIENRDISHKTSLDPSPIPIRWPRPQWVHTFCLDVHSIVDISLFFQELQYAFRIQSLDGASCS